MANLQKELRQADEQINFLKTQLAKNAQGERTFSQGSTQPDSREGLMAGINDWSRERDLLLKAVTKDTVTRQINAMHADVIQVGLLRVGLNESGERTKQMTLRDWDKNSLVESIGWLKYNNVPHIDPKALGGIIPAANINIRPVGDHRMTMIDDVKAASIQEMKDSGFAPSIVVETSPKNFQVWVDHGEAQPGSVRTAAAKRLAQMFDGDPGAAQGNHMGRLAGFTNRKEEYEQSGKFPWVTLHEANGQPYEKAKEFIDEISQRIEKDRLAENAREARFVSHRTFRTETEVRMKTIDDFRNQSEYAGDGHRSDIAYAKYALSRGITPHQVAGELRSRDLTKKGGPKQQDAYIKRTIEKAGRDREMER